MSLQSLHECPWLSLSAEPFLSFIIWNISVKHLSEANKEKERASHRGWVKIYQITLQEQPEIQPLVNICQNITDFNQFIKWSFWMFHYLFHSSHKSQMTPGLLEMWNFYQAGLEFQGLFWMFLLFLPASPLQEMRVWESSHTQTSTAVTFLAKLFLSNAGFSCFRCLWLLFVDF